MNAPRRARSHMAACIAAGGAAMARSRLHRPRRKCPSRGPIRERGVRRPIRRPRVPASAEPDVAYGAFQRGFYLTAFREATRRVEERQRHQGHDAARRALRRRSRHAERRQEGGGAGTSSPPRAATARQCSRSPCSGWPAAPVRATARRRRGSGRRGQARPCRGGLRPGAALSRGPAVPAGLCTAPPNCSAQAAEAGSPGGAIRAGNVLQGRPWRRTRTCARRRVCSAPRRSPATPRPRSNTALRCSTAPASPRTRPAPPTISCKAAHKG